MFKMTHFAADCWGLKDVTIAVIDYISVTLSDSK